MKIILIALLSLTLLSGCSWTRDIMVKSKPVDRIPLILPEADIYSNREVTWKIITEENASEVFAEIQKRGQAGALIGLTGDQYKQLTLNVGDQQLLVKQLNAIINAYKAYYNKVEKRDETLRVIE